MGMVYKFLRSVTEKSQCPIFFFWNGDILTLQIHFFSFCEHLVASAASCTAWMIMLVTCLNKNKKGTWGTNALHCFLTFCWLTIALFLLVHLFCYSPALMMSCASLHQPWGPSCPQQGPAVAAWGRERRQHRTALPLHTFPSKQSVSSWLGATSQGTCAPGFDKHIFKSSNSPRQWMLHCSSFVWTCCLLILPINEFNHFIP